MLGIATTVLGRYLMSALNPGQFLGDPCSDGYFRGLNTNIMVRVGFPACSVQYEASFLKAFPPYPKYSDPC